MMTSSLTRSGPLRLLLASLLTWAVSATAAEMPEFRQGFWEYERTLGDSRFVAKECGDPAATMREHNASLTKLGCKLSPLVQQGSTYTFSSECAIKLPSGVYASSATSVLTVESDSAYRLDVRETNHGKTSEQTIVAHRVADCER